MSKNEFVAWWLNTEFGKKKRLNWSANRTATCWEQFEQVADAKTGKPGAMCRHCHKVLDHPASGRYRTTALHRHLAGPTCRKSTTQKADIKGLLANAVCTSISISSFNLLTILLINRRITHQASRRSLHRKHGSRSSYNFLLYRVFPSSLSNTRNFVSLLPLPDLRLHNQRFLPQ
jgi:hypothetical protein